MRSRGDSDRRRRRASAGELEAARRPARSTATRASRAPTPSVVRRRERPAAPRVGLHPVARTSCSASSRARSRSGRIEITADQVLEDREEPMILEPTRHVDECANRRRDRDRRRASCDRPDRVASSDGSPRSSERMFRSLGTQSSTFAVRTPSKSPEHRSRRVRHERLVAGPEHRGQCGLLARSRARRWLGTREAAPAAHSTGRDTARDRLRADAGSRRAWLAVIRPCWRAISSCRDSWARFSRSAESRAHEIAGVCQLPPRRSRNRRLSSCGLPWPLVAVIASPMKKPCFFLRTLSSPLR